MNQAVKFKNSGFCTFLEEIGEDFECLEEVSKEGTEGRSGFWYFWVLLGLIVGYLVKDLVLVGCLAIFVGEVVREGAQKGLVWWVKKELALGKRYFLSFYQEKREGELYWTWVKEYCSGLEKEFGAKFFQADSTNPKHFERVFNSIELNCLIKGYKGVWGLVALCRTALALHRLVNRAQAEIIGIKLAKGRVESRENKRVPKFFHLQRQVIEVLKGLKEDSFTQEQLVGRIVGVKGLLEIDLSASIQRQGLKKKGDVRKPEEEEEKEKSQKEPGEQRVEKEADRGEDQQADTIFVIEGQGEQETKSRLEPDSFFTYNSQAKGPNKLDLKEFLKHRTEKKTEKSQ